ncbi:hypothetical protein LOCC1_G000957 [Lachnellula occidentalis]|uniref:BTB domain-containing protein n=1 Tax=Lachnellula occidentalis TaxID=215460 RepID=A0A8H8S6H1_9HELO|nr:hypothetical protein LOCC1_G000957 [Lachnellula occidentalis]
MAIQQIARVDTAVPDPKEARIIIIDPEGTLTIQMYTAAAADNGERFISGAGPLTHGRLLASIKASKKLVLEHSNYFTEELRKRQLKMSNTKLPEKVTLDIRSDHVTSVELWLRAIHPNAMTDEMHDISITDVWNTLQASRTYEFSLEVLSEWFKEWIGRLGGDHCSKFTVRELSQLLLPCRFFENHQAFAHVTMRYAYEKAGHCDENNPTPYHKLHLPPGIIAGINNARTNMKTKIHQALYPPIRGFLSGSCSCKKDGMFAYQMALDRSGAWPLEEKLHGIDAISIHDLLGNLATFKFEAPNEDCELCSRDYKESTVDPCVQGVLDNFEGLCLNCIDYPNDKNLHPDFLPFAGGGKVFDKDCHIAHRQPTWWFSWLASRERRRDAPRTNQPRNQPRQRLGYQQNRMLGS